MATETSSSKELLSKLSTSISIQSLKPDISIGSTKIPNLPTGISVTSVAQNPTKISNVTKTIDQNDTTAKVDDDLWNKFEQFRHWHESLAAPLPALKTSFISSTPIRSSVNSSSTPSRANNPTRVNRRSLPPSQGSMRQHFSNQPLSNQTLNQPLNPNVFLPGALKCFSKSRNQMDNLQNKRKYPQLSNETLKRQASTFMAAPSPEILAEMRDERFIKDFQIENCRSSAEYLHCLLGFGLYQTLNFPIMGVFYLELVRLIMKHLDRFSANEKVKLIQVSNVCEDILRQNSTRDDFLPVEVMDNIVEEAIKEQTNIQQMIEEFHGEQNSHENVSNENPNSNVKADISFLASEVSNGVNQKLNMFSNISVSLASESKSDDETMRNAKRKRTDDPYNPPIIIDLDKIPDPKVEESLCQQNNYKTTDRNHLKVCIQCDFKEPATLNINPRTLSGITISSVNSTNVAITSISPTSKVEMLPVSSPRTDNSKEASVTTSSVEKEKSSCHMCRGPFVKRKSGGWKICKCRKRVHSSCFKKLDPNAPTCSSMNFIYAEGSWTEL